MLDLEVIDDPAAATAVLDPVRARVLATLVEPGSATTVATAIGETRQKVNYHLRTLESHGLVRLVGERQRRGLTERLVEASARSYVVAPAVPGSPAVDPDRTDRLSSRYLIAVAARLLREAVDLARRADAANRPLATLTIDAEVRFGTAADRAAFTADLTRAVADLVGRYHDETTPGGRPHRLIVAAHPTPAPAKSDPPTQTEA